MVGKFRCAVAIIAALVVGSFVIGGYTLNSSFALDNTVIPLKGAQGVGVEYISNKSQKYQIEKDGTYYVELSGGGHKVGNSWGDAGNVQSGYVAGATELKAGDILNVVYLAGGASQGKIGALDGQAGLALEVNGKLVMGAGGAGGSYDISDGLAGGNVVKTDYSQNGQPLSGGAGGARDTYRDIPENIGLGSDGTGYFPDKYAKAFSWTYTSPLVGKYYGEPGGNYIDTAVVSDYVNDRAGVTIVNISAEFSPKYNTTWVWGDRPPMFKITKTTLGGESGSSKVGAKVHITVCQNQEYSCDVVVDTKNSIDGIYGNISTKVIEDNLLNLSGKETVEGRKKYEINGIIVNVTVVAEPSSSNIKVTLD